MSQHVAGAGSRSLVYERGARATGWRRRVGIALALAIVAFAVNSAAASAQTRILSPEAGQQAFFQGWIDKSLMPTPDAPVKVTGTVCPGGALMACTTLGSAAPVIAFPDVRYIFQAPYSTDTVDQTRAHLEFLHELGYVFDWSQSRGSGLLRSRFLRVMRISGSGVSDAHWNQGQMAGQTINPSDVFAMAYSYCSAYATLPANVLQFVYWGYGFNPSAHQYAQVCSLIKHLGGGTPVAVAAGRR